VALNTQIISLPEKLVNSLKYLYLSTIPVSVSWGLQTVPKGFMNLVNSTENDMKFFSFGFANLSFIEFNVMHQILLYKTTKKHLYTANTALVILVV
jgi:hypothetical protein